MPITKDALNGSDIVLYFAMISAWVGEKDLACEQLAKARNHSREVSYVQSNPLYCSLSAISTAACLAHCGELAKTKIYFSAAVKCSVEFCFPLVGVRHMMESRQSEEIFRLLAGKTTERL